MVLTDGSGSVGCTWFNQSYLKRLFQPDDEVIVYGKVGRFGRLQFQNPEYEKLTGETDARIHSSRITPIYPLVSGLYQRGLRQSLWALITEHSHLIEEFLPEVLKKKYDFPGLKDAFREIHFPASFESQKEARRRLVFDEFFLFEMNLLSRLNRLEQNTSAYSLDSSADILIDFESTLPFELTASQRTALQEIHRDLRRVTPMARLLQGDVGSGKTVVALGALASVRRSGLQTVLLAPTETLAEQHFWTLNPYFQKHSGKGLELLTGSVPEVEKKRIRAGLGSGAIDLVIGTHALLQDSVNFKHLALVVIDEQHKFGVKQRAKLLLREKRPHVLFMTATPIPRTLALTLYGDLHSTVIPELPRGRKPILTEWAPRKDEAKVLEKVRGHLARGEQGYFIYPAIEETEKSDRLSCEADFARIQKYFPEHRMTLIHGRLPAEDRSERMKAFRKGTFQVLISTSVIEVGIDNPNATFMVIQGAEYFGLSQLHQIRGRIGRGERASVCFLVGDAGTDEAKRRFEILTESQDGFRIAEEDLKLRGPGDFLGTRQSGSPLFRLANLITDQALLEEARSSAHHILDPDLDLKSPLYSPLRKMLTQYDHEFSD